MSMKTENRRVQMIAYTTYSTDARVRREAETIAALPNYSVSVLVLKERPEPRTYELDGVQVEELDVQKYRGRSMAQYLLSYVRFMLAASLRCARLAFTKRPDVVHVHNMPNFLVFAAVVPRLAGSKVILDIHDTMIETYATKFSGWSSRVIGTALALEESISARLAHTIICVNHTQRQAVIDRGIPERKIVVSMNLPDPKKFSRAESENGSATNGSFKLVYFGTITKRLGIDLAIRALAQIRDRISGVEFHVIGSGEDREEFHRLGQELGLDSVVRFSQGAVPLNELVPMVKRMDLVVVPNRRNIATELMLPVKMLEGIALGLPVVAPRLRTIQYYFQDDQVFYFEPENVESLAAAILKSYEDCERRRQTAARGMTFLSQYAWDTHKLDLINAYRSLTATSH
jgi:glycosyltransferase involved in cell wall biosynthesis